MKRGREWTTNKIRAVIDGMRTQVEKFDGDKGKLNMCLSVSIPVELLTDNSFERILKVLANKMFELNFGIVRARAAARGFVR
jgi:hypothetical protein